MTKKNKERTKGVFIIIIALLLMSIGIGGFLMLLLFLWGLNKIIFPLKKHKSFRLTRNKK